MNPITHLLTGWAVAQAPGLARRERAAVALASVVSDVDGLGIVVDFLTRNSAVPTNWWGEYHHTLGHNLLAALVVSAAAFLFTKQRWRTALLVFLSFHLHLLGDIIGARGPEGDQWPIHYLWPFAEHPQLVWSRQWALNAWPNFLITGILLALTFRWAWRRGFSPLELISSRADAGLVAALRQRFGAPPAPAQN